MMIEDNLMLKQEMFRKHNSPSKLHIKIPGIYMTYTKYMHGICHTYLPSPLEPIENVALNSGRPHRFGLV